MSRSFPAYISAIDARPEQSALTYLVVRLDRVRDRRGLHDLVY